MRWILGILVAPLLIALVMHPAAALTKELVGVWTHYGSHDAPQLASRATSIDLFLTHENGTVYRGNTGPMGIAGMEITPGIIRRCQVWTEGRLLASWPCNIPVGQKVLARVLSAENPAPRKSYLLPASETRSVLNSKLKMIQVGQRSLIDGRDYHNSPPQRLRIITARAPSDDSTTWVITVPRSGSKGQYNVFSGHMGKYRTLSDDEVQWWIAQRERQEAEFAHQRHLKFLGARALMPVFGALPRAPDFSDIMLIHFFLSPEYEAGAGTGEGG
jgi:hypothetical protein